MHFHRTDLKDPDIHECRQQNPAYTIHEDNVTTSIVKLNKRPHMQKSHPKWWTSKIKLGRWKKLRQRMSSCTKPVPLLYHLKQCVSSSFSILKCVASPTIWSIKGFISRLSLIPIMRWHVCEEPELTCGCSFSPFWTEKLHCQKCS